MTAGGGKLPRWRLAALGALGAVALALACARGAPPPRVVPEAEDLPAEGVVFQEPLPSNPQPPAVASPPPADPAGPAPEVRAPLPAESAVAPAPPPPAETVGEAVALRVGLATDLERVLLPCCDAAVSATVGQERLALVEPLRVEPAAGATRAGHYRLQVAALKDERQARELAGSLAARLEAPADARFDAAIDLYRVRVGRYASRDEAEAARGRLRVLGVADAWVVSEGGGVTDPALAVRHGDRTLRVDGRWLVVTAEGEGGIAVEGRRYRGRVLVYLNDRGLLNLINELDLEDYLRGVVPREMGPAIYDQAEALKAQTVAARTYALRNLGEFTAEGYDICATPRCQVYGGMEVEHPLTDRVIAETAGEVLLYRGELADTLYTSTCGGHTEDVEIVFPLKDEPYLKGVPCLEAGVRSLAGDLPPGLDFPEGLTRRLLPAEGGDGPAVLAARLIRLARLAGLAVPADRLASLERREVQRFVASLFDLALDARLFVAPEDVPYLVENPPPGWGGEDLRRAAYMVKSGLLTGPVGEPLTSAEIESMLLRLAQVLRVVREEEVDYLSHDAGGLRVRGGEGARILPLPASLATYRRRPGGAAGPAQSGPLALVAGDPLRLYWQGRRLLAVTQEIHPQGVAFDRSSKHSSWTRFHSDRELGDTVHERYPGLGFTSFEILSRGPSGRVRKIRLQGQGGRAVEVEGLAVRWTLGVPESLFTVRRLTPAEGEAGWLFTGRGWGHGVGMCQVGAYGMALRGHGYRDILRHYYTGTDLGRVRRASLPGHGPPLATR